MSKVFPNWVWLAYSILFALTIPWYLPDDTSKKLLLGLPLWLVASIAAILLVAIFTIVIVSRYWTNLDEADDLDTGTI